MKLSGGLKQLWDNFWFKNEPCPQMEFIRIGSGLVMLLGYLPLADYLLEFYGEQGWMNREGLSWYLNNPWTFSVLHYVTSETGLYFFYYSFLASCLALSCGFLTPLSKLFVMAGHVSFCYRNPTITYGVDSVTSSLLFILALSPIGKQYSLDCLIRKRFFNNQADNHRSPAIPWHFACTRLLQLQMCIIYLYAGLQKVRGDTWWFGNAVWYSLTNYQFLGHLEFFSNHYWLVNVFTYGTLVIELSYPYLIWSHKTRPYLLTGAIMLHLGIGLMMNMYFFSAMAILGHLAFFRVEWLDRKQKLT